mgnify:CR=1 FL=1|jgi:hypothetical protein
MAEQDKRGKSSSRTEREARLAEALRANLGRRKAQIRAREDANEPENHPGSEKNSEIKSKKIKSD